MNRFYHTFGPVFNSNSKLLILGSFPSVKSREELFYYAHPRNRFWKTLAALLEESVPQTVEDKKAMVLRHGIALWDCAESCKVVGSGDNTITEVSPVDIRLLLAESPIEAIFCNGTTAWQLYMEYLYPVTQLNAVKLPSTSPANAALKDEVLYQKWSSLLGPYLTKLREDLE